MELDFEVDRELMAKVMKVTGIETEEEAIEKGLRLLVEQADFMKKLQAIQSKNQNRRG